MKLPENEMERGGDKGWIKTFAVLFVHKAYALMHAILQK